MGRSGHRGRRAASEDARGDGGRRFTEDGPAEALPLVVGMHGDVGDVRTVESSANARLCSDDYAAIVKRGISSRTPRRFRAFFADVPSREVA